MGCWLKLVGRVGSKTEGVLSYSSFTTVKWEVG